MKFFLFRGADQCHYWHLKSRNGQIIACGGEDYKRRAACLKSLHLVRNGRNIPVWDVEKQQYLVFPLLEN